MKTVHTIYNRRNRIFRTCDAYFTVEVSIILPIVISVLLLVVSVYLFQYNRCLQEQDACILALRGATLALDGQKDFYDEIVHYGNEEELYILWHQEKATVTNTNGKVTVTAKGKMESPVPEWNLLSLQYNTIAAVEVSIRIHKPAEYIRLRNKLERSQDGTTDRTN